jgi:uncharacterized membrane protein YeaQ/YmgE (transglycosylase-associated protein family)
MARWLERLGRADVMAHARSQLWPRGALEMIMGIIAWLVLGLISGFIASKVVNKRGEGLVMDIVLGIVGALVGGFIANNLFGIAGVTGFDLRSVLVSVLGAIVVLVLFHMVVRRRARFW